MREVRYTRALHRMFGDDVKYLSQYITYSRLVEEGFRYGGYDRNLVIVDNDKMFLKLAIARGYIYRHLRENQDKVRLFLL